jgi:xanthine/CO dehydrogenase XdhC/CoxF family maturation factor
MKDVVEEAGRWAVRGDRIAIAMVVGAERSAPRPLGTKMPINDRGEIASAVRTRSHTSNTRTTY